MQIKLLDAFTFVRHLVRRWDVVALIVVIALLTFFAEASHGVLEPLNNLESTPLSLDPVHLPFYAARTTARMFTGLSFSLLFTLTYATWAATWNAAYVAEIINWKSTEIKAHGIGAYLAEATTAGDFHRILLGISVMCLFVVTINRIFWRPLYYYAERKFRIS